VHGTFIIFQDIFFSDLPLLVIIDVLRLCVYNQFLIEYLVRVPFPRMVRRNGEAGASPALSRNCKSALSFRLSVVSLSDYWVLKSYSR
jgi:hypothetical protein